MQDNLFEIFTEPLNRSGIEFFVTGSVAAIVYGDPRFTNDIDIVVNLRLAELEILSRIFIPEQYYLPPIEVLQTEINRPNRGHFNIIHRETMFRCDVYCTGVDVLHEWAFEHKRVIEFLGSHIMVAPPEYVIIRKLEFYEEGKSAKHISDIAAILSFSSELIDYNFLETQIKKRNLQDSWQLVNRNHTRMD